MSRLSQLRRARSAHGIVGIFRLEDKRRLAKRGVGGLPLLGLHGIGAGGDGCMPTLHSSAPRCFSVAANRTRPAVSSAHGSSTCPQVMPGIA